MDYELLVIGGGPGGYVAAIKAAQQGLNVCLVEKRGAMGGTCLNEGCIPTKALVHTAALLQQMQHCKELGITGVDSAGLCVDMQALQGRKETVVRQLTGGVSSLLKANGVTVMQGEAAFLNSHSVQLDAKTVSAENIIIATGSDAFMPPFIQLEGNPQVLTSREMLEITERPDSLAIIGGGVIGIEFAYVFSSLGSKVSVLEMCDEILPMVDGEIAAIARKKLEQQGVDFYLSARVEKINHEGVSFSQDGVEKTLSASKTLMAIGRIPSTQGLNAEGIGIAFEGKGIATDAYMRSSIPNIYAIGDVNGRSMLAHTASHEGMVAVQNILGDRVKMHYDAIPSCIYTHPEIAAIGLTEDQARERCPQLSVGRFPLVANGKALIEGEKDGLIKVIADAELGEILGVHMIAPHATDMIAEAGLAMTLEATLDEVINTVHPHPTVSEAFAEACMAARDKAIHFFSR